MVKKTVIRPSNGLAPASAIRPNDIRHPANFALPPAGVMLPRGSLGINQSSGRAVAAIANSKMPTE